jgi:hypothetical protein
VRLLRFVALLGVIVIAYLAQLILHPPVLMTSAAFFPAQLSDLFANFGRLRALFSGDLRDVAFFMIAVAAVSFGLLTAPWSLTDAPVATPLFPLVGRARRRQRLAWFVLICAFFLALAAGLFFRTQLLTSPLMIPAELIEVPISTPLLTDLPLLNALLQQAPWLTTGLWAVSLLAFFTGCALFPWRSPKKIVENQSVSATLVKEPTSSWPRLILLLLIAAGLYGWRLTEIPLLVDSHVAQVALLASDWVRNGNPYLFLTAPVELGPGFFFSGLATATTALAYQLTHDLLLSVRLVGVGAALATITATWLLGTELFRRLPQRFSATDYREDRGQTPALLATVLVTFTLATLLFSRLPILLETVAWGSLGCWALLLGLRLGDRVAIGLSGVLIGLSAILYTPGLVFVVTALSWWVGYGFLQTGWLPHRLQPSLPAARFRGYFILWVIGLWVVAAPALGARSFLLYRWLGGFQGSLTAHWQSTLLAFGQQGDLSQLGGLAVPFLHDLAVPLLFLAIGALCFNLDRRVGWMLLTWAGSGLVCAMIMAHTAPFWPTLLPLLPATSLIVAFGLDRLQSTIFQSAGLWSRNLFNYLLTGLILWVALNNAVEYYHFAQQQADPVSALGHELRLASVASALIVIAPAAIQRDMPQLRFLTNEWSTPPLSNVRFTETVPADLPAGAIILIAPAETMLLAQVRASYPNGTLVVRRDLLANRLLYRYTLPATANAQ